MRGATALLVAIAALGCDHDHASGMQLSVLKRTSTGCYRPIGARTPDPVLELSGCATDVAATIVPGVDQLQLVIDYGEHVEVSEGTALADPAVTVAFDGSPATAPILFDPVQRKGDRIYFVASYDVPVVAASRMVASAEAATDLRDDSEPFSVALPDLSVRIQECGEAAICALAGTGTNATVEVTVASRARQAVTLHTRLDGVSGPDGPTITTVAGDPMLVTRGTAPLAVPYVDQDRVWHLEARWFDRVAATDISLVAPSIELVVEECASTTGGTSACPSVGGLGQVHVDVTIPGDAAQTATLRSFLGGVLAGEQTVTTEAIGGHLTRRSLPVPVPFVAASTSWRLELVWKTRTRSADAIALVPPTPAITVEECGAAGGGCSATAGVGNVHAVVTIPADSAQAATLRSFLDGVLVSEQPVTTAVEIDHVTKATVPLAVPFAREGATWRLDLAWRSLTAIGAPITLHAPAVTSTIGCGVPCTIPAGTVVELAISAPRDLRASAASYRVSTATTGPIEATLTESTVNEATATRVWRTSLVAPATGTTWQIDASVAGYPATTILAAVITP